MKLMKTQGASDAMQMAHYKLTIIIIIIIPPGKSSNDVPVLLSRGAVVKQKFGCYLTLNWDICFTMMLLEIYLTF